jgi:hypothetical protein
MSISESLAQTQAAIDTLGTAISVVAELAKTHVPAAVRTTDEAVMSAQAIDPEGVNEKVTTAYKIIKEQEEILAGMAATVEDTTNKLAYASELLTAVSTSLVA